MNKGAYSQNKEFKATMKARYSLIGAVLSLGAPLGWLILEGLRGREAWAEPGLYAYMLLGTMAAFSSFGYLVGKKQDQVDELSVTDLLTGLRNRRYFQIRLSEAVAYSRRHGLGLGLILLDLDRFKRINDRYGHPVGDRVLQSTAQALLMASRGEETVARVGGEEFAVILPQAEKEQVQSAGERFRRAVENQSLKLEAKSLDFTASVGSSWGKKVDMDSLYSAADRALYRSKRGGRNRSSYGSIRRSFR